MDFTLTIKIGRKKRENTGDNLEVTVEGPKPKPKKKGKGKQSAIDNNNAVEAVTSSSLGTPLPFLPPVSNRSGTDATDRPVDEANAIEPSSSNTNSTSAQDPSGTDSDLTLEKLMLRSIADNNEEVESMPPPSPMCSSASASSIPQSRSSSMGCMDPREMDCINRPTTPSNITDTSEALPRKHLLKSPTGPDRPRNRRRKQSPSSYFQDADEDGNPTVTTVNPKSILGNVHSGRIYNRRK